MRYFCNNLGYTVLINKDSSLYIHHFMIRFGDLTASAQIINFVHTLVQYFLYFICAAFCILKQFSVPLFSVVIQQFLQYAYRAQIYLEYSRFLPAIRITPVSTNDCIADNEHGIIIVWFLSFNFPGLRDPSGRLHYHQYSSQIYRNTQLHLDKMKSGGGGY